MDLNEALHIVYKDKCQYCGAKCEGKGERDHIIPKSEGGYDDFNNIILACFRCNRKKRASMIPKPYLGIVLAIAQKNQKKLTETMLSPKKRIVYFYWEEPEDKVIMADDQSGIEEAVSWLKNLGRISCNIRFINADSKLRTMVHSCNNIFTTVCKLPCTFCCIKNVFYYSEISVDRGSMGEKEWKRKLKSKWRAEQVKRDKTIDVEMCPDWLKAEGIYNTDRRIEVNWKHYQTVYSIAIRNEFENLRK